MSDVVSDPRILRAIAHPTRSRILSELAAGGPARAADLAQELNIPANQASFHLRQLAKYGLVEEAPEEARDRRDRVWRRSSDDALKVSLDVVRQSPGGDAAVEVFKRRVEAWGHHLVAQAIAGDEEPGEARDERWIRDAAVRLSADEREEFAEDLEKLLERWTKRTHDRAVPRTTYSMFMVFQPYPAADSEDKPRSE
jgi:predicted ArsR family transcriptional regulator